MSDGDRSARALLALLARYLGVLLLIGVLSLWKIWQTPLPPLPSPPVPGVMVWHNYLGDSSSITVTDNKFFGNVVISASEYPTTTLIDHLFDRPPERCLLLSTGQPINCDDVVRLPR